MQAKSRDNRQASFLYPDLLDQLNPAHPLLKLAKKIPWQRFEDEFAGLYSQAGRPAKPIRLMVGLMMLKQLENLSDERVVEAWVANPYFQAFCGETRFHWKLPCNPSDFVYFRKRIGEETLQLFKRVHKQKRTDKNKVYSLHEPDVLCIGKGKEHKKYEFGRKASLVVTKTTGVIVGALSFTENVYDGNTLPEVLEQTWQITGTCPQVAICDRGYRGRKRVGDTEILTPRRSKKSDTPSQRRKARERFRRRAGIEPVIGHVKHDHRMARNFLKGVLGDAINLFMAAAAFNFRTWMRRLAQLFALSLVILLAGTKKVQGRYAVV